MSVRGRLTWNEIEALSKGLLGEVPPRLPDIWAELKYQSSATGGLDCVDVVYVVYVYDRACGICSVCL